MFFSCGQFVSSSVGRGRRRRAEGSPRSQPPGRCDRGPRPRLPVHQLSSFLPCSNGSGALLGGGSNVSSSGGSASTGRARGDDGAQSFCGREGGLGAGSITGSPCVRTCSSARGGSRTRGSWRASSCTRDVRESRARGDGNARGSRRASGQGRISQLEEGACVKIMCSRLEEGVDPRTQLAAQGGRPREDHARRSRRASGGGRGGRPREEALRLAARRPRPKGLLEHARGSRRGVPKNTQLADEEDHARGRSGSLLAAQGGPRPRTRRIATR